MQQREYLAQLQKQKEESVQQLQQEISGKQAELEKQAEQRLLVQSYLQQTWHKICEVASSYQVLYRYGSFPPLETFQSARRKWLESVG